MVVFAIITFGLYYPVWWFRRRGGLNRLNSFSKIPIWPLLLMVALFAIQSFMGIVEGGSSDGEGFSENTETLVIIFQFVVGIAMLIMAFRVKDIIEEHASPDPDSGAMSVEHVKLSGLMTFFFSIFYLQWAINRYVVGEAR
jgi:hypothetical protein